MVDVDPLLDAQLSQVIDENLRRHQAEGIVVGPGTDRPDDLLRLGRREDELDVRRGLLHEFQQGVEALRGDHVGLVDDVNLVARMHWGEKGALPQVPSVIHATVGGRVNLDDVNGSGAAAGQVATGLTLSARSRRRTLFTVQRSCKDASGGCLATATRS